ncbi:acid protease, partial [Thozetella sp. PMI_491]
SNSGFLSFPIHHKQQTKSLGRRNVDATLFNISVVSYLIELDIGTPAQTLRVAVDTGSDELWVNPDCSSSTLVRSQVQECQENGSYKPGSSSTATVFSNSSEIQYGSGFVEFDYVVDTIAVGDSSVNLSNVQFGVATSTEDLSTGILGLSWGNGVNLDYDNFVDILAEQGVTESKAFSVALGSDDLDNGGVLIFGGLDTSKFTGSLVGIKMLGRQGRERINRYWVQLNSVGFSSSSGSTTYTNSSTPVILDTGSSLSYLPTQIVSSIARDMGATFSRQSDLYLLRCSAVDASTNITFAFDGITINIPASEFVLVADSTGSICALGALGSDDLGIPILGDSFMRSAYVVFDQTQNTISMAQYVNCGESAQAIPPSGVAGVSGQCS